MYIYPGFHTAFFRLALDLLGLALLVLIILMLPTTLLAAVRRQRNACDFALARYNEDGSLDTSFGDDRKVTTHFGGTVDQAFALAIRRNGKIVPAGSADGDFALARYLAKPCRSLPASIFMARDEDDDLVCH